MTAAALLYRSPLVFIGHVTEAYRPLGSRGLQKFSGTHRSTHVDFLGVLNSSWLLLYT